MDQQLTEAIGHAVERRRSETEELLRRLVRARSITGDESAMSDATVTAFLKQGLETSSWAATAEEMRGYSGHVGEQTGYEGRNNVVGRLRGTGGGRSLLLNAHIDTVPEGDHSLWSVPPFEGRIVGDRLYGRGSCDMKGGLVTHLASLQALADCNIRLKGDVTVAATVGEEDGGLGALAMVLRGFRADAALVTEPTQLALVTACEGSLIFRLTITGRAAHAAARDEGVSAVEKFIPIYHDLMAFERERNATLHHPLYDALPNKVPVNVGVVRAGNWASTVPETLEAEVRVGLLPGEDIESFKRMVIDRILSLAVSDPWLQSHPPIVTFFGGQFTAAETPADAPICAAIRAAHQRMTGREVATEAVTYGADMRHFINFGGMPCVMYGAGDIRVAHAPDEFMDLEQLFTAVKVVAGTIVEWCGRT